jgi:hypothetical protein
LLLLPIRIVRDFFIIFQQPLEVTDHGILGHLSSFFESTTIT